MTIGEVKKIKKFLEQFDFCEITESFVKLHNTYEVELLNVWQEDGIIGFYDYGKVIEKLDNSVIGGFILSSAELTVYKEKIIIKLKNETITVKGII
jgi:hypothetical protein